MRPDAVLVIPLVGSPDETGVFRRLMTYHECAIMEVETKLKVFDAEFGLQHDRNPIESICSRLKSVESMVEKLEREKRPVRVEVQMRSIAMNFWASLDHQLQYKKALTAKEEAAVADELRALSDAAAELDARMQRLSQDLFEE